MAESHPIVATPPPPAEESKVLMVALDAADDRSQLAAFTEGLHTAVTDSRFKKRMCVLALVPRPKIALHQTYDDRSRYWLAQAVDKAQRKCEMIEKFGREAGIQTKCDVKVCKGDLRAELCREVRSRGIDRLVVPQGGGRHWLPSLSMADFASHHCNCESLLVVKRFQEE